LCPLSYRGSTRALTSRVRSGSQSNDSVYEVRPSGRRRAVIAACSQGGRNSQEVVIAAKVPLADNEAVPRSERLVVVVAFDHFQLLDLSGPVEVLRSATLLGADPPYRTLIATPKGRRARSESGVAVDADVSLAKLARGRTRIDTLVGVGG